MKALLAAAVLALAATAGTARANTFAVVGGKAPAPVVTAPVSLPSAEVPNAPGSLLLPPGWTVAASTQQAVSHDQLSALWQRAGAAYGIPWQVLAAINKIETNFGQNMGPSSAGAVGWMQFMPDTWLRWGMDATGDGFADPWNAQDAIFAAARYLAAAGGRTDLPRAVFAYNHADWYVKQVLDLAALYGASGAPSAPVTPDTRPTFELDRLQTLLDEARGRVAEAARRLARARAAERRLARKEAALEARAAQARLLSRALELDRRAAQIGLEHDAAARRAAQAARRLKSARKKLEALRSQTQGAAFSPGAGTLFGTPAFSGGYVFPVGGGPSVVSVGHTHHDYPAADIAAPQGSPLYALADGVIQRAWGTSEGACGIGLILDTVDGQSWTYCHLSYLEPGMHAGVRVSAGQPVGLVGSTGRSTGPHLHLGLRPTTSYPQQQAWFRSFAGIAFRWQDAPTPEPPAAVSTYAPAPRPVFAVVETDGDGDGPIFFTRSGG